MPREQRPLILIIIALVAAALALEVANGRFWLNDFRVYWSAADALVHGRQVYGLPFGEDTGFFKYAPIVAIAFVPLALLPYWLAATIHFALIGVALILVFTRIEPLLMRHVFGFYPPRILLRGMIALTCVSVLLSRELHLGNINLWLVVITVLATRAVIDRDDAISGFLFGILWLTKPYLLFMAVPLVAAMRWKTLRNGGIAIAVGIALPVLVLGPDGWLELHRGWLKAMSAHSGYLTSPDTVASLLTYWSGWEFPAQHTEWLIVGVGLLVGLGCWWQRRTAMDQQGKDQVLTLGLWTALALVPHLVITDQEHFLFSLPLIAFTLALLFQGNRSLMTTCFVAAMFLFGSRSSDLWGPGLESMWVDAGALGIGNLLLIGSAWAAYMFGRGLKRSY